MVEHRAYELHALSKAVSSILTFCIRHTFYFARAMAFEIRGARVFAPLTFCISVLNMLRSLWYEGIERSLFYPLHLVGRRWHRMQRRYCVMKAGPVSEVCGEWIFVAVTACT